MVTTAMPCPSLSGHITQICQRLNGDAGLRHLLMHHRSSACRGRTVDVRSSVTSMHAKSVRNDPDCAISLRHQEAIKLTFPLTPATSACLPTMAAITGHSGCDEEAIPDARWRRTAAYVPDLSLIHI